MVKTALADYFDLVYNPVYDLTTAQSTSYQRWQEACLDKLRFADGDKVLCIGAGTGNEIIRILQRNYKVNITAIDASGSALERAYQKAKKYGQEIRAIRMDAHTLEFPSGGFDTALCFHLMDFLSDTQQATAESLRILREGGQFAITYPYSEGLNLMISLAKESLGYNLRSGKYGRAILELWALAGAGIVYLPILFRPKRESYSYGQLEQMFRELKPEQFNIEERRDYQDFIIYGRK
jgi:ubiquinone/menaquinone biosynthesis C-methylase UbiE